VPCRPPLLDWKTTSCFPAINVVNPLKKASIIQPKLKRGVGGVRFRSSFSSPIPVLCLCPFLRPQFSAFHIFQRFSICERLSA